MRLELLIVTTIFLVFFGLNLLGENIQLEKKLLLEENITQSNETFIDGSNYIIKQMSINSTKSEVINLTKKNDLILEEELKEKNAVFVRLVNETK